MRKFLLVISVLVSALASVARAEFTNGDGVPLEYQIVQKIIKQAASGTAPENAAFQKLQAQFAAEKFSSSPQCELYNEKAQSYEGYEAYPLAHVIHCWDYVTAIEVKDGKTVQHMISYTYDGLLLTNFSDFRVLFLEKAIKKVGESYIPKVGGRSSSSGG